MKKKNSETKRIIVSETIKNKREGVSQVQDAPSFLFQRVQLSQTTQRSCLRNINRYLLGYQTTIISKH